MAVEALIKRPPGFAAFPDHSATDRAAGHYTAVLARAGLL